jgi:hypothetical protein
VLSRWGLPAELLRRLDELARIVVLGAGFDAYPRSDDPGGMSMELNKSSTAFLACHWEDDVVGSDGAFATF